MSCKCFIFGTPDFPTILMGGKFSDSAQDAPIKKDEGKNNTPPFQMFTNQHGNGPSGMFGPGPISQGNTQSVRGEFVSILVSTIMSF